MVAGLTIAIEDIIKLNQKENFHLSFTFKGIYRQDRAITDADRNAYARIC